MEPPARMVDWYRADPWPRMRRVLLAGPMLLTLGGLVVSVSFMTREPTSTRELADIAGLFLVAAGAAITMAGMHRILRDDAYLSIRSDGVQFQSATVETFVAWDELACARWDPGNLVLVLERRSGPGVLIERRFAQIEGPALAERIERARRRASMGMDVQ